MKPLHPIQVEIIKILYKDKMSVYKISKILKLPTPQIQFHVARLVKYNILKKMKKDDGRGFVYTVNKEVVEIKETSKGTFIVLKVPL